MREVVDTQVDEALESTGGLWRIISRLWRIIVEHAVDRLLLDTAFCQ